MQDRQKQLGAPRRLLHLRMSEAICHELVCWAKNRTRMEWGEFESVSEEVKMRRDAIHELECYDDISRTCAKCKQKIRLHGFSLRKAQKHEHYQPSRRRYSRWYRVKYQAHFLEWIAKEIHTAGEVWAEEKVRMLHALECVRSEYDFSRTYMCHECRLQQQEHEI